ncbi:secondary thiamine-phosphate synthase enzyme YjbQ [uncultured Cohaesibacter sp.]|uniref:secondary thiamine-phosphate synthase enzyme YjbQ n=1 Tax=uncultured Cohaesibacter sp. TaxID=1002546 RepID=UPI0029C8D32C|nr:secondary thiamine-phosphate synthase enzyme YjbQ [uncultured Cohaesibacter sp.]
MPLSSTNAVFDVVHDTIAFQTTPKGIRMITREVVDWVASTGAVSGTVTVFCLHTSASLSIQENADPTVREDVVRYFDDIAPADRYYEHSFEGPDDMPAHLKSMLTSTSLTIPVQNGRLVLGQWQGIYLMEHRAHAYRRRFHLTFTGLRSTS